MRRSRMYSGVKGKYIDIQMRILFSYHRRADHKTSVGPKIFDSKRSSKAMPLNKNYKINERAVTSSW